MTDNQRNYPKISLAAGVCMMCLAHSQAIAQTTAPDSFTLKEVVISASRQEQLAEDLPLLIDLLGSCTLEAGQIGDIRDAAKNLPNVSVKRAPARFSVTGRGNPAGADGNAGFNIRGQGGNRVIMLIDGVRLPRSYINGSNAFSRDTVSVGLLKRIELVRGPASALYGSDGLAGLVNFITLEPDDFLQPSDNETKNTGGRAWLGYSGDDKGLTAGGTLARRVNEFAEWSITATTGTANGLSNMGSNDSANVDRTTPNPQSSRDQALLGKLMLHPSASQRYLISLEHVDKGSDYTLLSSRAKAPLMAASIIDESATSDMTRNRLTWDARYQLNSPWADNLQTVLSWQQGSAQEDGQTVRHDQGVRLRQTSYQERTWQLALQADKTLHLSRQWVQKISYGLDYVSTDIASFADGSDPLPLPVFVPRKYFPDTRDTAQAAFVQSEFIHDNWSVIPGVRFDQFALEVLHQEGYHPGFSKTPGRSMSGSAVSPKLGLLYRATPEWSVYGNYAHGFRAPEGQQVNSAVEASTARLLPNPDLKPEQSRNLEIGARARLKHLTLDIAAFSSKYSDLIQEKKDLGTANGLAASVTNPTLFQTVNIDLATISGFEIRGNFLYGAFAHGKLSFPFGYGIMRGSNDSTGQPLTQIEPAHWQAGIKYETSHWDIGLNLSYHAEKNLGEIETAYIPKSDTQLQFLIPAATTLDLRGQWRIRKDRRLNFGITNLTDQKYWNWSDVQGLASNPTPPLLPVVDAYTQPGRHINLSLVADF